MLYESWVEFGHGGTGDFDHAITGLEHLSGEIPSRLQDSIETELSRLANVAKGKLLAGRTHGIKHTGLRARIAAGVTVVGRPGGAAIEVRVPNPSMRPIPWGLDTASDGWMHPVFGRDDDWVKSEGTTSWWHETMQTAKPTFDRKLPETIDDAVKETFEH